MIRCLLVLSQSGARINISDASCPERIVTVAGTTQQIVDAFSMICRRFEEVSFHEFTLEIIFKFLPLFKTGVVSDARHSFIWGRGHQVLDYLSRKLEMV